MDEFKGWYLKHHPEDNQVITGVEPRLHQSEEHGKGRASKNGHLDFAHLDVELFQTYIGTKMYKMRKGVKTMMSDSTVRKPYDALVYLARELK